MFKNVTLEMSLKPFKNTDEYFVRKICKQIFEQWRPLLKGRKTVSVMLWVGDGSEILDYAGNMDDSFEWARFLGTANQKHLEDSSALETSIHDRRQDYIPHAPIMTYKILKNIVSILKEEGNSAFPDTTIRIGETFDIGPEFAISDFRYNRHKEICVFSMVENEDRVHKLIDATSVLHKDDRYYAAYPFGIPEGTPFATFLGKQAEIFLSDMGFDYIWLSNGLGFSSDPWQKTGKIFDGEKYYPEKLQDTKDKVFKFWKSFRKELSFPIETRGTNNSVGIDYASDGVPLYDIYNADLGITAPPNSPWAALNDNFGLEIMGHMTRICELPSETFPFRYYIHDPWWINSPWYDRYDGSPSDIYLPMSISRIDKNGKVQTANSINILAIDNSYGQMPENCINEPLPHILKAEKNSADEPAPLVWVYPMREYTTSDDSSLLCEMNLCDSYVMEAINEGLPLCCVTSTDSFLKHDVKIYKKCSLISPVPENGEILNKLRYAANCGIKVLIYGTGERLSKIEEDNFIKISVEESPKLLIKELSSLGYDISFRIKKGGKKPPTMTLSRHDNALFLSVYNCNTTTDTYLRFPLGAPLLLGTETEIIDGKATYRFSRGEQRECRAFAEQKEGVISVREAPPINAKYRRAIKIDGLENATVYLFPEKGCEAIVSIAKDTDLTPIKDNRFVEIIDEKHGRYLKGENISGKIYFLMGKKATSI